MDQAVFGTTEFEITNGQIFGRGETDTLWATFDSPGGAGRGADLQRSNFVSVSLICNTIVVCEPATRGFRPASMGTNCNEIQQCTMIWSLGAGEGWWPWENGGGGGAGGGYNPPQCQGNQQRGSTLPGCPPRGWRPRNYNPPPYQNEDSLIAARLKRLTEKGQTQRNMDSLHNVAQQDGLERTFTFNLSGNDTLAIDPLTGRSHDSKPNLYFNSFAIFHTHQEDDPIGESDKNQCFDGPDIYKLYKNAAVDGYHLNVFIISTRDYYYAAIITDLIKFRDYIRTICGTQNLKQIEYKLNDLHIDAMDACVSQPTCNWQKKTELGILAITANNNSSISGIKIFRSPKQSINYTLLTP